MCSYFLSQGTWWLKDKSPNFSSLHSLPWLPWWFINTAKGSAQTVMDSFCSAALLLLRFWWLCGWSICGTTLCYATSTLESYMFQNPGPSTPYMSKTNSSSVLLSRSASVWLVRKDTAPTPTCYSVQSEWEAGDHPTWMERPDTRHMEIWFDK